MPPVLQTIDPLFSHTATLVLGAAVGWLTRRWWYRFEKRNTLKSHLNGWRTEIENIDPILDGATDRIWATYRAGVPDVQRISSISDFHKATSRTIYRVSHIPYNEVANAEGDKRETICKAINAAIHAIK